MATIRDNEKGQTTVSPLRVLPADREGLRVERAIRARIQRQAPFVELGLGAAKCTTRRAAWDFPLMAGSSLAGDMAHAFAGDAGRRARPRGGLHLLWRRGQLRFSRRSKPSSAWWSAGRVARSGVKWVQAYRGEDFWKAHQEGVWSQRSDGSRAMPKPHAQAGARRIQRHFPDRRRHARG